MGLQATLGVCVVLVTVSFVLVVVARLTDCSARDAAIAVATVLRRQKDPGSGIEKADGPE